MNRRSCRWLTVLVLACLVSGGALMAQPQKEFPNFKEIEFEHSIITIPIILEGETEPAEVLKLDAFMRLDREKPVRNGLGYRQFEFTIDAWELYGYSKVLDANITFKVSETVKPKSLGISLQKNKDYPAMIVYNAIYDIYLNDVKVGENLAGVAVATGVMEIPPRNVTVAFHKPFVLKRSRPDRGDNSRNKQTICDMDPCPCYGDFCMDSGTCEDMSRITSKQFDEGVTKAKAYRMGTAGPGRQIQQKDGGSPSKSSSKKSPEKSIQ